MTMETRWRRNGTTYEVPAKKPRDGVTREPYRAPTNPRYPVRHVGERQRAKAARRAS